MNRTNILQISARADVGGGPKHMLDLTTQLKTSYGDRVAIYGAFPQQHYAELLRKNMEDIVYIPPRSLNPVAIWKLWRFCKKNQITLVHSHGRAAGYYAFFLNLLGYPFVHTFHGIHSNHSLPGRLKTFIDKIFLNSAKRYLLVSPDEYALFIELPFEKSKAMVIPNGVAIQAQQFIRSVRNENVTLGTLTRNDPAKGNDLLVENFSALSNYAPISATLLIAGEGFPPALSTSVKYVGYQKSTDFIKSIDVYVSNSRKEGMPLAVLEALSLGIPCLLSNVPGHRYFINNNVAVGFTLDDPKSFADGLQQAIARNLILSKSAVEFVKNNHSLELMTKRIFENYNLAITTR
jgi:glycosyltransferase involved in cell wall biosynthesis